MRIVIAEDSVLLRDGLTRMLTDGDSVAQPQGPEHAAAVVAVVVDCGLRWSDDAEGDGPRALSRAPTGSSPP